MKILYTDILPLKTETDHTAVVDCFNQYAQSNNSIEIAVGYVSKASLEELDALTYEYNISKVILIIGMYYIEGMPESIYHTARKINEKWVNENHGEIRLILPFKYHGKVYAFYSNDQVKAAILGSANLSILKLDASNRRQYELAIATEDPFECKELAFHIRNLQKDVCSKRIDKIVNIKLIREVNTSLTGIDLVQQITPSQTALYKNYLTDISFTLPIKVPSFSERHMDDGKHFTRSNINVCYATPRSSRKSRDWYETQLTVSKKFTKQKGYPEKNIPFFIVTDDGYMFKAHTTSDGNKQLSAVGDELIMGRWIKGRLVAAGLVSYVNDTLKDTDRKGIITKEMLYAYGCNTLILTKTSQKIEDNERNVFDVWMLSFEAVKQNGETDYALS